MLTYFWEHIPAIAVILVFLFIFGMVGFILYENKVDPTPEKIIQIAEGRLINMRYMGSQYNDTELKFQDGSMCVVPYRISRNLREWTKYKIWCSSFHGWQYKEIK